MEILFKTRLSFTYALLLFALISTHACDSASDQSSENGTLRPVGDFASNPQATLDNRGHLVLWWIQKEADSGDNIVAFARSTDQGNTFSDARTIPKSRGANGANGEGPPRLIFKDDGTILLLFNKPNKMPGHPFAGDVLYTQSTDNGNSWSTPEPIHRDGIRTSGQGFPAVTHLPNGEVAAVWLDGRHNEPHSSLYFAVTDGDNGFGMDKKIGGPSCQCCKISMLVDDSQTLHISYRSILDGTRDIMHLSSTDMGDHFTKPVKVSKDQWEIEACPHNGPDLTQTANYLHSAWYTNVNEKDKGVFYTHTATAKAMNNSSKAKSDQMNTRPSFEKKTQLSSNELAKHIKISALTNNTALIVWDEKIKSVAGEGMNSRIAYQLIKDGRPMVGDYLTTANEEAFNPSILQVEDNLIFLVWTEKKNGQQYIKYRKITLGQFIPKKPIKAASAF